MSASFHIQSARDYLGNIDQTRLVCLEECNDFISALDELDKALSVSMRLEVLEKHPELAHADFTLMAKDLQGVRGAIA